MSLCRICRRLKIPLVSSNGDNPGARTWRGWSPTLNLFYYPDLVVTCDRRDLITNQDLYPKLIIEVLSDSTEAFDRGDKFADYKLIPELEEYILIHQKQMLVEQFLRKSDNLWLPQIYRASDIIEFSSIEFSYGISAIYENISQLL